MKRLFLFLWILWVAIPANGQKTSIQEQVDAVSPETFVTETLFSVKEATPARMSELGEYVRHFNLLEVNTQVLNRIVATKPPALQVQMPFNGATIILQLITSKVVNEKTVFSSRNSFGKTPVAYQPGAYYYGVVKDQSNTLVAISFFQNTIIGIIADDTGNHVLGKSNESDYDSNEYILYNDKDLTIENPTECFTGDTTIDMLVIPDEPPQMVGGCEEVGIYIETDRQVYLNHGSNVANVLNFVTGLFNVTTTIYQNESITTYVSETLVWTIPDPYIPALNTFDALTLFGNEMLAGFNGDLAHLFSARALGGGRAWLNVLCGSNDIRTAVSGDLTNATPAFPIYSDNAFLVTHEIGHNLGSPHTHACLWNGNNTAIDGCGPSAGYPTEGGCPAPAVPPGGGTIMSYCNLLGVGVNFNLGFGAQPGDLIRDRVSNAACLGNCCNTDVVITGNNYSTPLTESDTWITSSGQTTILNTADVRLDADPADGYIQFNPPVANDFFHSQPIGNGVFVAQALDGCNMLAPAKMNPSFTDTKPAPSGNEEITTTGSDLMEESDLLPGGFALYQNTPNPFSKNTTVVAVVPEAVKQANIILYNLQGLELASYPLPERGKVSVEISGGRFPSGMYLYALVADGQVIDTKKMILMD